MIDMGTSYPPPEGLNILLFKVFEKYNMKDKAMLCLWHNGQLNTAIRESSRILELQDRLKEWLPEIEGGKGSQVTTTNSR